MFKHLLGSSVGNLPCQLQHGKVSRKPSRTVMSVPSICTTNQTYGSAKKTVYGSMSSP